MPCWIDRITGGVVNRWQYSTTIFLQVPLEEHDPANVDILDLCGGFILRVHALPYLPP